MKKPLIIHPFLFAISPILFLFFYNIGLMSINELKEIAIPIAITTSFTFLSWSLLSFILKDKKKAGLIVSLFLLLFFSYGHFVKNLAVWGVKTGEYRYLFLATWGMLFTLGTYFSLRTRRNLHNFTVFLNIMATSLVAIPIATGVYGFASHNNISMQGQINAVNLEKPDKLPNIYYIILDGYARADVLKNIYQYDNSNFLDYLIQKGFYVASKSSSNYGQTYLSVASSLNLIYLDDLVNQIGVESGDRTQLRKMIKNNSAANFLKQYGYLFVAFSSGYSATEIENADIYMTPRWALTEFQNMLINTTPIPIMLGKPQYDLYRHRLLYIFDQLANMTKMDSPVFVFAHITAPHPPFVFGEHGEQIRPNRKFSIGDGNQFMRHGDRDEYVQSYKRQLTFINKKVKETIDNITSSLSEPPIIILQADHGPGSMLNWEDLNTTSFEERMSILNAYYLPHNGHKQLYDEITPVNTFRVIFNHYFGTNYELLKDESYFSTWGRPYKFIKVTDEVNADIGAETVAKKQ